MNITEKLLEAIDEVLNDREKEVILSFLDNADEIDFDDFWRKKNYDVVGEKGLTCYHGYNSAPGYSGKNGFRPFTAFTVRNRVKSAFDKLEKSPKLRTLVIHSKCVTCSLKET